MQDPTPTTSYMLTEQNKTTHKKTRTKTSKKKKNPNNNSKINDKRAKNSKIGKRNRIVSEKKYMRRPNERKMIVKGEKRNNKSKE